MKFLTSRHVLILMLTLLAIEGAFRMGLYEPLVNPMSHSGRTITMLRALADFGLEKVNVITLGDSRAAQGLNNRQINEASHTFGLEHVRMTMPGSHLLTFRTLTNWGFEKLPGLQGIVLLVSPASFNTLGAGAYELAKVLPIRNYTTPWEMLRHVPFERADVRTYSSFSSLAGYREDIKNLLADPWARGRAIVTSNTAEPQRFLNFSSNNSNDLCAIATDEPKTCLNELSNRRDEIPTKSWNALNTLCRAAGRKSKHGVPGEQAELLLQEWTLFLDELSQKVRVMLVIMPDHSIYQEKLYAPNAIWLGTRLVNNMRQRGKVEVLDLHRLIQDQKNPECSYYMDAKHLNKSGNAVLTQALLPALENFWSQLEQ